MRSLFLTFAAGQLTFAAPGTPTTPTTPTTTLTERQFLFANPAADALALQALRPNATNPFATILLAGAIDGSSGGGGYGGGYGGGNGGYGGGYGGGYPQRPAYPSYPTYPTYPSFAPSYPPYTPSYPAYTPYTPSYPAYTPYTPSYPAYTPYTPSYPVYTQASYPAYTPSYPSSYYQPSYPRPRSPYPDPPNDPLKQAVILSGIQKGTINPVTAVGLDRNPGMSALGAQVFSSLGDSPITTALAVNGGLGGNNYYSQYGGNVFGGSGVGNLLFYDQVLGGSTGGGLFGR
jgi:hypothetical protein